MANPIAKIIFIITLISCFAVGYAFSDNLDVAVKGGYFNYMEPTADVDYAGMLSGIQFAYNRTFSNLTVKARTEYMSGQTTYNGHINMHQVVESSAVSSNSGTYDMRYDTSIWYTDSAITMSFWHNKSDHDLLPYIGLGYRYMTTPKSDEVEGDYKREITYLYLPIAFQVDKETSDNRSWGFTGEINILIHGWVKAHTSDISERCGDMSFDQSLGGGFKLGSYYKRNLFGLDFSVSPFAEMWLLGDSDTDVLTYDGKIMRSADGSYYSYCEPANITTTLGLKFNILI